MNDFFFSIRGLFATLVVTGIAAPAAGQILADELPPELDGVGIVQKLDDQIPLDLSFVDHTGASVQLSQMFDGSKPMLLTMNYYRCPMLCSLTLNGLVDGLRRMSLVLGTDYDIVTISINPDEGPELAAQNRQGYLAAVGGDASSDIWPFFVGEQADIESLAKAVGFGYRYDERSGEYAHTASVVFLTPEGTISKYMNDVTFNPRDVRLALVDASQGRIGTLMDTLLLFNCFQWDPEAGSFVPSAWKIMRLGAGLTAVVLAVGIFVLLRTDPRRGQRVSDDIAVARATPLKTGGMQA
ncbi:MAG: SCO family protein [Phycisphaerales bacterium]|nr:SCO family protein [Phycisphaerales bacterium]